MKRELYLEHLLNIIIAAVSILAVFVFMSYRVLIFGQAEKEHNIALEKLVISFRENIVSNIDGVFECATSIAYNELTYRYLNEDAVYDRLINRTGVSALVKTIAGQNKNIIGVNIKKTGGQWHTLFSLDEYSYVVTEKDIYIDGRQKSLENGLFFIFNDSGETDYFCYLKKIICTDVGENYGKNCGTLLVVCKSSILRGLTDKMQIEGTGQILITDLDNRVIMSVKKDKLKQTISADEEQRYNVEYDKKLGLKVMISDNLVDNVMKTNRNMSVMTIIIFGVFYAVVLALYVFLKRKIIFPIKEVAVQLESIGQSGLKGRITVETKGEISAIVSGINQMIDRIELITRNIFNNQQRIYEMEVLNKDMSLKMLQHQINPHFLYNTLESIRSMAIYHKCPDIADIVVSLAKIFRYNVQNEAVVVFENELEMINEYIKIMNCRMDNKIKYTVDIPENIRKQTYVKMCLQPVVENSVKHGLGKKECGGSINVSAVCCENTCTVRVTDNGVGMTAEKLDRLNRAIASPQSPEGHIGLWNVNQRICLHYGTGYGVSVESRENFGTEVTVVLPYREE